jgi:hypothetical protein
MPPVEERKGLLVTLRGTPQQQIVSVLRCDPRLPCCGFSACASCVFCLLPYFPAWPQKVPMARQRVDRWTLPVRRFWSHGGLDVYGDYRVSAKGSSKQSLAQSEKNGSSVVGTREWFTIPRIVSENQEFF